MRRLNVRMTHEAVVGPRMIIGNDHNDIGRRCGAQAEHGQQQKDESNQHAGCMGRCPVAARFLRDGMT
jgi:hypothetical protein